MALEEIGVSMSRPLRDCRARNAGRPVQLPRRVNCKDRRLEQPWTQTRRLKPSLHDSMFWRGDGASFDCFLALGNYSVGRFFDHLFQQESQMRVWPVICRGDMLDAIGVGWKLVTFTKANAVWIVGIINGDRLTAVLLHDGEAGDIGRSVTDVDHIGEGDRSNLRVHVVVYVLPHVEQALVNSKKELRLLRVADDALRENDPAMFVLGKFASENGAHIRLQPAAIEQDC